MLLVKRAPYSSARVEAHYREGLPAVRTRGIPPLEFRRYFPFANADVAFQLP